MDPNTVYIYTMSKGQLALTVLEGIVEGLRHQGRPRRQWIHDIEEWTGSEYIQLKEINVKKLPQKFNIL